MNDYISRLIERDAGDRHAHGSVRPAARLAIDDTSDPFAETDDGDPASGTLDAYGIDGLDAPPAESPRTTEFTTRDIVEPGESKVKQPRTAARPGDASAPSEPDRRLQRDDEGSLARPAPHAQASDDRAGPLDPPSTTAVPGAAAPHRSRPGRPAVSSLDGHSVDGDTGDRRTTKDPDPAPQLEISQALFEIPRRLGTEPATGSGQSAHVAPRSFRLQDGVEPLQLTAVTSRAARAEAEAMRPASHGLLPNDGAPRATASVTPMLDPRAGRPLPPLTPPAVDDEPRLIIGSLRVEVVPSPPEPTPAPPPVARPSQSPAQRSATAQRNLSKLRFGLRQM